MPSLFSLYLSQYVGVILILALGELGEWLQQPIDAAFVKLSIRVLASSFCFQGAVPSNGFHIHYIVRGAQLQLISVRMNDKSTLPLFHFLFCELIQECYANHKEDNYLEALKRCGYDIGFRMYNLICIRKQINERPSSIAALMKNIQLKVFRFLFNYDAFNVYTASSDETVVPKQHYHVIEDNISVYLTWMPEHLWDTSAFFAGLIQAICHSSGLECKVTSYAKMETGQNPITEYQIKITQAEVERWKQNQ